MWRSTIHGITLANIESTQVFRNADDQGIIAERTGTHVADIIKKLPWYYRIPLIIYGVMLGLLAFLFQWRSLLALTPQKRKGFLKILSKLPFYGLLDKLVRSLAFMKLYDETTKPPVSRP